MPRLAEAKPLLDARSPHWRWATQKQLGCLLASGRNGESLSLLAEVLGQKPPDRKFLLDLASEFLQHGKLDLAEGLLEQVLALGHDSRALQLMSSVQVHRSWVVAAASPREAGEERARLLALSLDYLQQAIELTPEGERGFARMELANRLLEQPGRTGDALQAGQQALDEARASVGHGLSMSMLAHMYVSFGRLLYGQGQREAGSRYMDQGVEMAPSASFRHILELLRKSVTGKLADDEARELSSYTIPDE